RSRGGARRGRDARACLTLGEARGRAPLDAGSERRGRLAPAANTPRRRAMSEMAIGMVGLGVMGRNLSLNMEEKGFSVAAYDAWPGPVDAFAEATKGKQIAAFKSLEDFVRSIQRPRRIIMLVKAGEIVDKTIAALRPLLEP